MIVRPDDPTVPDVRELLEAHLALMRSQSPPEDVHALDVAALQAAPVTFLSCRSDDAVLLGIGALARLSPSLCEVKSMHTATAARGRGVARSLLRELLSCAVQQGFSRISPETGSQAAFAPARALYRSEGFQDGKAFGDYRPSDASTFLTRSLPSAG